MERELSSRCSNPRKRSPAALKRWSTDGLRERIPKPDVAFAQHVLAYPAGKIGTQAGPVLSAGDSIRITLHGKGAHGSMPQNSVDPVVLAALVVLRLQTIVSRETKPGEFAVLTVGSSVAGSKSNIIPDRAVLLANLRTYDTAVRQRMIDSIERMVKAECEASGSPQPPEFEYFDQYPLTENDPGSDRKDHVRIPEPLRGGNRLRPRTSDRQRRFQPHPRRFRNALLVLGLRRHGPEEIPESTRRRTGGTGHPGQSFGILCSRHRADAVGRHSGARGRGFDVSIES